MSDKNITEDQVEIPEDTTPSFSESRASKGLSPTVKIGGLVAVVFIALGASVYFSGRTGPDQISEVRPGNLNLDATPGMIAEDNTRFQDLLRQSNDQMAEDAAREGRTYIPIPEARLERVDRFGSLDAGQASEAEIEPQEPEVAQVVEEPAAVVVPPERQVQSQIIPPPTQPRRPSVQTNAPNQEQEENPYMQAMIQQMGTITRNTAAQKTMGVTDTLPILPEPEIAPDAGALTVDPADEVNQILAAGAILYGETLTSSTSDLPGPVLVRITNGPLKGSRLIGAFTTAERSRALVVEFSSMSLPDGDTVAVSAFAVDGFSAETAVASDVDNRYVRRYGPILAASFITGFSQAAAQPGQQVVGVNDGNSIVTDRPGGRQSLFAGVAAASEAIGTDLIQNAPRGPEIKLQSGWPIAVLFTDVVVN